MPDAEWLKILVGAAITFGVAGIIGVVRMWGIQNVTIEKMRYLEAELNRLSDRIGEAKSNETGITMQVTAAVSDVREVKAILKDRDDRERTLRGG